MKYDFPGGIAQLVERQLCKLDVRGSNPLASKRSEGASYIMRSLTRKGGKAANPLASKWSFKFVRIKF